MSYNAILAERVRTYLTQQTPLDIREKKMFGGLAFLINGKMCINISGNNLMCRFDPGLTLEISKRKGFKPMVMKGKTYKGYCYVKPGGFQSTIDFIYWLNCCLDYNKSAKGRRKSS